MTEPRLSPQDLDELASAYVDGEATQAERAQAEADPAVMERVERFRAQAHLISEPYPEPENSVRAKAIAVALSAGIGGSAPEALRKQAATTTVLPAVSIGPAGTDTTASGHNPTAETTSPQAASTDTTSTDTATTDAGQSDYTIEAASVTGLSDAVNVDGETDASEVSTTAPPSDSRPHRPTNTGGDGGRGRRRWYQKLSPAAAAVVALVAVIGGVGLFAVFQDDDNRVTSTASTASAYAEDALDASADAASDTAAVGESDASLEALPEIENEEEAGSSFAGDATDDPAARQTDKSASRDRSTTEQSSAGDDAAADEAMSDEAMSDGAMFDDAMSDEATTDEAMFDGATSDDAMSDDEAFGPGPDLDEAPSAPSETDDGALFDEDSDEFGTDSSGGDTEFDADSGGGDAEFEFAESDSIAPFKPGGSSGSGSTGGGGGSGSGGPSDTGPVALDQRSDYLGTFSTISMLMSEATERGPQVDERDLPEPLCDAVQEDLDDYSPSKLIGTGRINDRDYVVYLISDPDRYDTTAAASLSACSLEIGQPYTS